MKSLFFVVLLAIAGCSTMPAEQVAQQREWREGIDSQNYQLCEQVYNQFGHSFNRVFDTGLNVKATLQANECKHVLGKYWASY